MGGGANGLYPFLKNFYPNGVQAMSGTAYQDAGVTLAVSGPNGVVPVTVVANGRALGSTITGVNGYYYVTLPAGTIAAGGSQVVAYTAGATGGATFRQQAASPVAGLNIYGTYLREQSAPSATTLSAVSSEISQPRSSARPRCRPAPIAGSTSPAPPS